MGLIETLRKAEQQGRNLAHRGLGTARDSWEDAERRIRRKMRIFPNSVKRGAVAESTTPPDEPDGHGGQAPPEAKKHAA